MRKCSKSLIIREIQIKTSLRYHLTPSRLANITARESSECWRGCSKTGTLMHCWWSCELIQSFWMAIWNYAQRVLNTVFPLIQQYHCWVCTPQRDHREKDLYKNSSHSPIVKWARDMNRQFQTKEIKTINKHMKKCSKSLILRKMQIKQF